MSIKKTIIGLFWLVYFAGFFIKTTYGYFFDPILKYKGLMYNIGAGLVWFTIIPIVKDFFQLIAVLVFLLFIYSKK